MNRFLFIILLITFGHIQAQNNLKKSSYSFPENPEERIVLTTDRDFYLSGEKIWFSAHCIFQNSETEDEISKVLYIEIINEETNLKYKFSIQNGISTGSILLPEDLETGNYLLLAYTQYLKNYSEEYFFTSILTIINPNKVLTDDKKQQENNQIRFFTDYQYSDEGIIAAHAFLIEKDLMKKMKHLGIENTKGEIIANAELSNSGMGYFEIDGTTEEFIFLKLILENGDTISKKIEPQKTKQISPPFSAIKANKLLEITSNKRQYTPREKVQLNIKTPQTNSKINLSISITKKGTKKYSEILPNAIFSNRKVLNLYHQNVELYTLSEIDQKILNVVYNQSFLNKIKSTSIDSKPRWIPEIRDVSISGIAINKKTHQTVSNLPIFISAFKDPAQFHIIRTKEQGEFIYSLNNLTGSKDVFLCPRSPQNEEIELQINNDFIGLQSQFPYIPLEIDTSQKRFLEELHINKQAGKIYKTDPGTKKTKTLVLPYNFENLPISIKLDDYVNTPTLEMVFNELIPRCSVIKRKGNYFLTMINDEENVIYDNPMVLVDNIPIFDDNELMKIHPSKINKIECLPTPIVLGDNIIEGLVKITTHTDNFADVKMPEGSIFLSYQMISPSFQFEAPTYNTQIKKQSRKADFRTTLYWNPKFELENNKTIEFYTSDHCSEYEVVIKGISAEGDYYIGKSSIKVGK